MATWLPEWRGAIRKAMVLGAEVRNAEDDLKVAFAEVLLEIEDARNATEREARARCSAKYGTALHNLKLLRVSEAEARAKADALEKEYELHRTAAATARVRMQMEGDR